MHKLKLDTDFLAKKDRLYQCPVPIVGITGGIATGKSTVSKILREKQFGIIDADSLVKKIYKNPQVIEFIRKINNETVIKDQINFKLLRKLVFENSEIKTNVETLIYEQLPQAFGNNLSQLLNEGHYFIFYDVPLLFEKGLNTKLDRTCTVYCPRQTQMKRLLKRDNISQDLAKSILDQQMDIEDKKQLSDYIINNTSNLESLKDQVDKFLTSICF